MSDSIIYDDPTTVNDASPRFRLGTVKDYYHSSHGWWKLKYVQFKNAVTYAAGQVTYPIANDGSTVTNDITGGAATPWAVIFSGLALGVMTENYYGWVLVRGYYPTIKTSGADDIAAGESLICHGSTDGTCDGVAANAMTVASFGVASAADVDANNTVAGFICGPVVVSAL